MRSVIGEQLTEEFGWAYSFTMESLPKSVTRPRFSPPRFLFSLTLILLLSLLGLVVVSWRRQKNPQNTKDFQKQTVAVVYDQPITRDDLSQVRLASQFAGSDNDLLDRVIEYRHLYHYLFGEKFLDSPPPLKQLIQNRDDLGAIELMKPWVVSLESANYKALLVSVAYCEIGNCPDEKTAQSRREQSRQLLKNFQAEINHSRGLEKASANLKSAAGQKKMSVYQANVSYLAAAYGPPASAYDRELRTAILATAEGRTSDQAIEQKGYAIGTVFVQEIHRQENFDYEAWLKLREEAHVIRLNLP